MFGLEIFILLIRRESLKILKEKIHIILILIYDGFYCKILKIF